MKYIKDPIHGYIDIPEDELSIINTKKFQRLRRINQLGLSSTVYPSATHTRFSHSIGVMELSREISESVGLSDQEVKTNQVAGLVHDLGHLPFSHTLEDLFEEKTGLSHEDISCNFLDDIATQNNFSFSVEDVKSIIKGEYDGINIVSNEIDADRLDYLVRDSYYTGIELGNIERDTLIKFCENIDNSLGFDYKSLRSVEQLLDARMQMDQSVYSHDTVNITETMLERSVEKHFNQTDDNIRSIIGMEDRELIDLLLNSNSKAARLLFEGVHYRNLYKTSYYNQLKNVSSSEILSIKDKFNDPTECESEIARMAGINDYEVLISPPRYKKISEFDTKIRTPNGDIDSIENVSPKPQALRRGQLINSNLHIFTKPEYTEEVNKASKEYLDSINISTDF